MTAQAIGRGLLKVLLVLLGAAAGAVTGGLLGALFAEVTMPNGGLEALGPMVVGTFLGSVVGGIVLLLVLFRFPRMSRDVAANVGGAAVMLLALGAIGGLLTVVGRSGTSMVPLAASTCAFLAVLLGLCLAASALFGRQP